MIKYQWQGKDKLNNIEVSISKALIDSYISHNEFVLVNNVLRECYEMKKEMKSIESFLEQTISKKWKPIVSGDKLYC